MDARKESNAATKSNRTSVERTSDREVVISRTFDAPARLVFDAWTKPELMRKWWVPKSTGLVLLSCEQDVRTGGSYKLVFEHGDATMAFVGKYLEVVPALRLVWTNEESESGSVTTVTFEEKDGKTLLVMHELYRSKEAFEEGHGMEDGLAEAFGQLDELLVVLMNARSPRG